MADYPFVQPALSTTAGAALPLAADVQWDFVANRPVFFAGNPVVVTGADAVASWAARALQVVRYLFEAYSWDYGCEAATLIGQKWSPETKLAEAERYIKECLLQSPYVSDVTNITAAFDGSTLTITATMHTIYGDKDVEVQSSV